MDDDTEFKDIVSNLNDPTTADLYAFRKAERVKTVTSIISVFALLAIVAVLPWVAVSWIMAFRYPW